jgi:AAA+ superfamily predicted ATPase
MFSLDLTAVMSSRLGQSGANLRYALDFAKGQPSVLFLDEIDSIAKRRADQADVGELKRLVTIMLQELDDWPSTSLLLAATNHPELVDPALWRRFGLEVQFPMPAPDEITVAIRRFLGPDAKAFENYLPAIGKVFVGDSYSDIERALKRIRRSLALTLGSPTELAEALLQAEVEGLSRNEKIELAVELSANSDLSQHQVSRLTTVSRDTIRKHSKDTNTEGKLDGD